MSEENKNIQRTGLEVAVVGMAGRFPGAKNIDEFWVNLKNGIESISFLTDKELGDAGIPPEAYNNPSYIKACGPLEDREFFDALFFGYTPKEAELMDPQMRIFYECAWTALEDAACDPNRYEGAIGLYAGGSTNLSWENKVALAGSHADFFTVNHLCNIDFLSTRVAHKLNLKGPAITFQTACSTGLVAVNMGCRELITGQCDMALAGAVSIPSVKYQGYGYEEGMVSSSDGHCRSFDARSRGTIFSDGVGTVVLKRLEDAIADRNTIHAVILGTAVNNDGIRKNSFQAPCVYGQADVIQAAHQVAGVQSESIGYLETHGTGTTLGDPIEVEALKIAFNSGKKGFCGLGSVKSNIGHVDTAAGIAGFIKTVLVLKHRLIPPSLHFETPNPKIDFDDSPFYVNTSLREWEAGKYPRRAAVSSFGVGGTNAHAVLEEAPGIGSGEYPAPSPSLKKHRLIIISARTAKALDRVSANLTRYLQQNPRVELADVAYTLQVGRKALKRRKILTASTVEEAVALLAASPEDEAAQKVHQAAAKDETRPVFMFSGQGAQYVNMGLDLYKTEPVFREEMDLCFEILDSLLDYDIKEILYPVYRSNRSYKSNKSHINQTEIAQPLLFAIEYALVKLLMHWGIQPFAMIGHSIGEYTAACLSGVFTREDALKIVASRGKLMQQMPSGAMLSVSLPAEEITPLLDQHKELALAAVNAASLCVVSGPHEPVTNLENQLKNSGYDCRRLHTSHAFHSAMMDPILEEFERCVSKVPLNKPRIPYISNVTGNWITVEQAVSPRYWANHLRRTVQFAPGLTPLLNEPNGIFIEVGPGRSLSTFINKHPGKSPEQKVINLIRHPQEEIGDDDYLLNKIGQLWLYGQAIDWEARHSREQSLRLHLPAYPFEKEAYSVYSQLMPARVDKPDQPPTLNKNPDISQWFYTPSWRLSVPLPENHNHEEPGEAVPLHWLIFANSRERIAEHLVRWLKEKNQDVTVVLPGDAFNQQEADTYTINPGHAGDYEVLLAALADGQRMPNRILHGWNISELPELPDSSSQWEEAYLDTGFYSLIYLAQAIGKHGEDNDIHLTVLTNNMQEVTGEETLCPHKATILGPVMIIPREFPHIKCRSIDIVLPPPDSGKETSLIRYLISQCQYDFTLARQDSQVAFRGNYRFARDFDPVPLLKAKEGETSSLLRSKGVYLVTGGLGGIGLVLGRYLAQQWGARLVITGRSEIPPKEEWDNWLHTHPQSDPTSQKIRKARELEHEGAEVLVFQADAADIENMQTVIDQAEKSFGPINGVIHCAGLPGGGMIQLKNPEMAARVLAPKMKGALVLDRLFQNRHPDFLVFCSSINSIVPILGQVDYFAANAFLDAFACYKNITDGHHTFVASINWDTWQQVGMAVDAVNQQLGILQMPHPHPLLEQYIVRKPGQEVFLTHLDLHHHWVLHDHRTAEGMGLVPGSAYLEMVHAAFIFQHSTPGMIEIRDVRFITPLLAGKGDRKEVVLVLKKQEKTAEEFDFSIFSQTGPRDADSKTRFNHARGNIRLTPARKPGKYDIKEIKARCSLNQSTIEYEEGNISGGKGLLVFGPRWKSLHHINFGENQGLALIELDEPYTHDLDFYQLHPALLDIATSFLYSYINPHSPYIPFFYKRLTLQKGLPAKLLSYSRWIDDRSGRKDLLKFNVTLMDETGEEIAEIEEFTMLEVTPEILNRIIQSMGAASQPVPGPVMDNDKEQDNGPVIVEVAKPGKDISDTIGKQPDYLKNGILPAEGIEVFTRVLAHRLPRAVLSTTNLWNRFEQARDLPVLFEEEELEENKEPGILHQRPELDNAYVAPKSEIQQTVANIWQEILGIEGIGIHDNFFELGGDSLSIVQLTGKLKKVLNVDVPVALMFRYLTIHSFARYLDQDQQEEKAAGEAEEKIDRSEELEQSKERMKALITRK